MTKIYGISVYPQKVIVHGIYNTVPVQFEAHLGNVWSCELLRGRPYDNRDVTWTEPENYEDFPKVLVVPSIGVPFLKKGNPASVSAEKSLRTIDQLLKAACRYWAVPVAFFNTECVLALNKRMGDISLFQVLPAPGQKLPGLVPMGVIDGGFQEKPSILKRISGEVPEIINKIRETEDRRKTQFTGSYGIAITTDGRFWDAYKFEGSPAFVDDTMRKIIARTRK